MVIAVLSGKGGTGKTFISVNLAAPANESIYIDCDVEEPNGHLFFKPIDIKEREISVKIPFVDNSLCNGCRKCVDFCSFNALAYVKDKLLIFDEVCHSCGGCVMVCPQKTLSEKEKVIGKIQMGMSEQVKVYSGILNINEPSGVPIIKNLLEEISGKTNQLTVIDCPPGSACTVMESIKSADYCILVAEPTIFGVHNLKMVYELVKLFGKKFGVVLNKCVGGENLAEEFCLENSIKIIGRIAFDYELKVLNSDAVIAVRQNKKYLTLFSSLLDTIIKEWQYETTTNT